MTFQTYNVNGNLTSIDVVSTTNIAGFYFNGTLNNGVGATLTLTNPLPLIIDGVTMVNGSQILLIGQTNANENGIYIFNNGILERRNDFQCIEQLKGGQYLTVADGATNKGAMYVVVDPLPVQFGIDPIAIKTSTTLIRDFSVDLNTTTPPNNFFGINSNLSDSQVINQPAAFLAAINGRIFPEGSVNAQALIGVRGGVFLTGGTYTSTSGKLVGVYASLNLEDTGGTTTLNGALVAALYGSYEFKVDVPTDVSKLSLCMLENLTTGPMGQVIYATGEANNFITISNPTGSYTAAAGTTAGSAGDPTKCNANRVIKVTVNGVVGYLPIFNSNA